MKIVFWQQEVSILQSAMFRELAGYCPVTLVADVDVTADRVNTGWHRPDCGDTNVITCPSKKDVASILSKNMSAVHVVCGIRRGCRYSTELFQWKRDTKSRVGIQCEAPDPRGWKGLVRRNLYSWYSHRYNCDIDFILAMGKYGVDRYTGMGFPSKKIFPYCYVVDRPAVLQQNVQSSSPYRFLFIGNMIPRKAIDVLLHAVSRVRGNWVLDLVGNGPEQEKLKRLADRLGIAEKVLWSGTISNMNIGQNISMADLFILPSHYDGWGAVINEALMSGVPVVCSDKCAACDLLGESWLGTIVKTGNSDALAAALQTWYDSGKRTYTQSIRIQEWCGNTITNKVMARYLIGVLNHVYENTPCPDTPWHITSDNRMYTEIFDGASATG